MIRSLVKRVLITDPLPPHGQGVSEQVSSREELLDLIHCADEHYGHGAALSRCDESNEPAGRKCK